jgi:hypothetical protein
MLCNRSLAAGGGFDATLATIGNTAATFKGSFWRWALHDIIDDKVEKKRCHV